MTFALLVQSMVIGLSLGSTYILMALGLTLMFGMMHIINFTHGAVYMLGAFVIYYFFGQWGVPYVLSFFLAIPALTGASDYADHERSNPSVRRAGVVHAAANSLASGVGRAS